MSPSLSDHLYQSARVSGGSLRPRSGLASSVLNAQTATAKLTG